MANERAGASGSDAGAKESRRVRPSVRRYLTISWVVTIVGFTLVRLLVANETLAQYGLSIWTFGAIDLLTAVPYALGMAKVVTAVVDRQAASAGRWIAVALASFIAPYCYIVWVGRSAAFPPIVYIVLVALVVIFGVNAGIGVLRKVRAARSRAGGVEDSNTPVGELAMTGAAGPGPLLGEVLGPHVAGDPAATDSSVSSQA